MDEHEIKSIISRGESSNLEFKLSIQREHGKTLSAFANGFDGQPKGFLIYGVDNDGNIAGFRGNIDQAQRDISDTCRQTCQPPLSPVIHTPIIDSKNLIVVEVSRSSSKPHRFDGRCYIRVGSTTRVATSDEEFTLRGEALLRSRDDYLIPNATIEDIDSDKVMAYYRATRSPDVTSFDKRELEAIIEALGLTREEGGEKRPTIASMLVFGKNPQKFIKLSSINAIRFRGDSLADPHLDRKEIVGTLDEIISEAASFVERFSAIGSTITSESIRRVDVSEYPAVAIRESIANAVVHRDYLDTGSQIDLYIFDDRIEIRSPGGLGGGVTIDDLENHTGRRWLRNPEIAGKMYELKYIEQAGTGISRMFGAMSSNGSSNPIFEVDLCSVKVVLPAHPLYSARRKYEEAVLAKNRGEIEIARKLFSEALQIEPEYSEALTAWATMEGEIGNLVNARKLFGDALKFNPINASACLNWALLEDRIGETKEARLKYKLATEIEPKNPAIWHSWANMERRLGNFKKARELYMKATKLQPESSLNWQSWAHLEMKDENYAEAERLLRTALKQAEIRKDTYLIAWIMCDLARVLTNMNRPVNEIEHYYVESLKLNPNSMEANYGYSVFLRKTKRYDESDEYKSRAIKLGWNPHHSRKGYRK